jgi:hypothetical protein
MQPIATIGIKIDHFLCLNIICSHFISIKRGKLGVFSKFTRNSEQNKYLSYKYVDLILLIIKKKRGISNVVLLEIPFLY